MLDWFPNADHAPLYAAIAHGDFRAVGLDVKPVVPSQTDEPLKLLAAGKVDMAISYEPELLLARDQGLKLVSIGGARAAPVDLDHRAAGRATCAASPNCRARPWAPPASPTRRRC